MQNVVSADVWNTVACVLELLFIRSHFYTSELFTFPKLTVLLVLCVRSSFDFDCVFIIFFFLCVVIVYHVYDRHDK